MTGFSIRVLGPSRKRHKSANTPLSLFLRKKSEGGVGETERMTIEKFYWPMGLGPDRQEDTKPNKAKEYFREE